MMLLVVDMLMRKKGGISGWWLIPLDGGYCVDAVSGGHVHEKKRRRIWVVAIVVMLLLLMVVMVLMLLVVVVIVVLVKGELKEQYI